LPPNTSYTAEVAIESQTRSAIVSVGFALFALLTFNACEAGVPWRFTFVNQLPGPVSVTVSIYDLEHSASVHSGETMSFSFSPGADAHFHVNAREIPGGKPLEEDLGYVTSGTSGHATVTMSETGLAYQLELSE
jgi:hypothetical protein